MFDAKLAYDLALRANRSYDNPNIVSGCVQALHEEEDELQYLSAAGTKDFEDALRDMEAQAVQVSGLGHVHAGVEAEALQILPQCIERVKDCGKPLYIDGHSLGSAISQRIAWSLSREGVKILALYGFGGMRGFGADSRTVYNALAIPTTTLIHGQDMIPDLPPWGFRGGQDVYLGEHGGIIPARDPGASLDWLEKVRDKVADHRLVGHDEYIEILRKMVG